MLRAVQREPRDAPLHLELDVLEFFGRLSNSFCRTIVGD